MTSETNIAELITGSAAFTNGTWRNITGKIGQFAVKRRESLRLGIVFLQCPMDIAVGHNDHWLLAVERSSSCWTRWNLRCFSNCSNLKYVFNSKHFLKIAINR